MRSISRRALSGLAVAATVAALVTIPAPAFAASHGTPAVQTQRMSKATLNSTQHGWYARGQKLTLVCYERGQSVKGYYSRWISGGWDNLWYRVSDGYYVADVDIETGSNNPITPACSTKSSTSQPRETRAVNWALSMIGSKSYTNLCGRFVANAYGQGNLGYTSARVFYDALKSAGQIHTTGTPPKGSLVFSQSSMDLSGGKHLGHVALAVGDGRYVTGGVTSKNSSSTVAVFSHWNPAPGASYLGWAYAPSGWKGR